MTDQDMADLLSLLTLGISQALTDRLGEEVHVVLVVHCRDDCHSSGNMSVPDAIGLLGEAIRIMKLQSAPTVGPVQ